MGNDHHLATMAKHVTTTSAMNPALMLCLMVCPLAFTIAAALFYAGIVPAAMMFSAVGAAPLAIACWQLIRFTISDPDRLQREQHLENMLALQQSIGIREGDTVREIPISSQLVNNPQIEDRNGE